MLFYILQKLVLSEGWLQALYLRTEYWGKCSDLKREEVTGGWRKLHNEELRDTDSLASIKAIKTRRMRRVECVACFVFSSWHRCLQSSQIFFMVFLFSSREKYTNNYAENIRHHGAKSSWLGDQITWYLCIPDIKCNDQNSLLVLRPVH